MSWEFLKIIKLMVLVFVGAINHGVLQLDPAVVAGATKKKTKQKCSNNFLNSKTSKKTSASSRRFRLPVF